MPSAKPAVVPAGPRPGAPPRPAAAPRPVVGTLVAIDRTRCAWCGARGPTARVVGGTPRSASRPAWDLCAKCTSGYVGRDRALARAGRELATARGADESDDGVVELPGVEFDDA